MKTTIVVFMVVHNGRLPYSDKKLELKCLAALVNLIAQQVDTLEEGLKVVDSLPLTSVCKFNLRELFMIKLKNNNS